jgi:PAS domain-containing protein
VVLCNSQAQDLSGLSHDNLVGKPVDELVFPPLAQAPFARPQAHPPAALPVTSHDRR